MPGANFKRLAKEWKQKVEEITDEPFYWVKEQMVRLTPWSLSTYRVSQTKGAVEPSFVSTNLEDDEDEYSIKCTAVAMYGGATIT